MVLVDERLLDNLWRKQDTSWKRPADYKAKTILNSQLKTNLDDFSIPDDVKVKTYQNNLNRFLHTSRKQTEPATTIVQAQKAEPEVEQSKAPKQSRAKLNIVKRRTPKHLPAVAVPKKQQEIVFKTPRDKSPRVKRLRRKPLKFAWSSL